MRKKVNWQWDYGVYVPLCPYCNEPAYETKKCVFCGKRYKWVDGEIKETIVEDGEYTIVQCTNHHIHVYQGEQLVMHSSCDVKKTEEELKELGEFVKSLKRA